MPIDKTELATEIEKNPEILTLTVEALQKKGYSIYDKDKHTAFLDNFKKDVIEKEIPKEIEKVHSKYDQDIEGLYGIKKEPTEKSYEYLKRAAGKIKGDTAAKIVELEKAISEKGDPKGILTAKIEKLENEAAKAIADRDKEITKLKGENDTAVKGIHMQQVYGGIAKDFKKVLPPMFDELSKMVLEQASALAVMKDDKLFLGDGTGAIKKDASFKEITMEDHLKLKFKDVIDVERKAGGAGSGKGEGKETKIDPATINKNNFEVPATVKNRDDLMGYMREIGIVTGTPQAREIWNKFALGIEIVEEGGKKIEKKVAEPLPA